MFYEIAFNLLGVGADNWAYSIVSIILLTFFSFLLISPFYIIFSYVKWHKKK